MQFELFISLIVISLVSLTGAISVLFSRRFISKIVDYLVAFAIGALLGNVFLHFIPELIEIGFTVYFSFAILLGFFVFFVLEKFLNWHHCHSIEHSGCKTGKNMSYMILIGDAFHNFIDGVVLAGSFLVSVPFGFSTALAIILHEIPQEIGDFSILLKGGFSRSKALFYNFLSSLSSFLGAVLFLYFSFFIEGIVPFVIAFTAGSFLYIAMSDLIPELHKSTGLVQSFLEFVFIILGVLLVFLFTI